MKKNIVFLMVIMMIAAIAAGCKKKKPVNEERIKEDAASYINSNNNMAPFEIEEISIVERKTDSKAGTDEIRIKVVMSNDAASVERTYVYTYRLYDQGWSIDSIQDFAKDSWTAVPYGGPDELMVSEHAEGDEKSSDIRLSDGEAYYYYEKVREHDNCTEYETTQVSYSFDNTNLIWKYVNSEQVEIRREWDIDGTWEVVPDSMLRMGAYAIANEYYKVRADIKVDNNETANIHIYAYGERPSYFNIDKTYEIYLDPNESAYATEKEEFSETVPGYRPTSVTTCLYFGMESVGISNFYPMERISK